MPSVKSSKDLLIQNDFRKRFLKVIKKLAYFLIFFLSPFLSFPEKFKQQCLNCKETGNLSDVKHKVYKINFNIKTKLFYLGTQQSRECKQSVLSNPIKCNKNPLIPCCVQGDEEQEKQNL